MAQLQLQTLASVLLGRPNDAALFVADGFTLTRSELLALVTDAAGRLQAAGIRPGDVISIAMTNTVEFVVAFLATTFARAVAAPLNSNYKVDEFKFYMEDAQSKLFLVPADGNKAGQTAAASLRIPTASLVVSYVPGGRSAVGLQAVAGAFGPFPNPGAARLTTAPQPADVGLFLHTSGTTSRPKGVPLTHANLAASLANIVATYELAPADRSYLVMPLFHVHGLMAGLLAPLAAGGAVILPAAGKFSAHSFWGDCCRYGATFFTAVPTIHQVLLARAASDYPAHAPPPLRFIRSCSSSLAPSTLAKLEDTFKVPVLEAYAMTEASHQMTSNPLPKHGPHRPGSVGRPQGSVQLAILDGSNRVLPPGKIGEVCVRGPNVTAGYLNNPAANKEAYAGGWFHTGDQGWLDEEGYLTLTGRLKELINRGGEKISPLEVDGVLLSHPQVAEAVCFGAPDEKYGEVVAAAVVLREGAPGGPDTVADIQRHAAQKLSAFKVPQQVFITKQLPKTATGKIQRRFMVEAFITGPSAQKKSGAAGAAAGAAPSSADRPVDGYRVVAEALAALGVKHMFGVIGIPVTQLASAAQAAGIRFLSFRNEQAAGYAAAAAGFLTSAPGVLLTVSGPGAIHGIAGLSHAAANCWPLLMLSGSAPRAELGKGAFQECDQLAAVRPFCKFAAAPASLAEIPQILRCAYLAAAEGRPGAAYVDLPSDVLMAAAVGVPPSGAAAGGVERVLGARKGCAEAEVAAAAALLRGAKRPLVVAGKGAAYAVAEEGVRRLANQFGLPVLCTSMGRGLLPDGHPLCVNAARSLALREADVVVVAGARLNWQLHFGEAPRWGAGARFVLLDVEPSGRDAERAEVVMRGDAALGLQQLADALAAAPGLAPAGYRTWVARLQQQAAAATQKLEHKLQATAHPLDYYTSLRVIRDQLEACSHAPIVVSEGANTMDNARLVLRAQEPRTRLDAGTWGTMGVGLGSAVAAAVARPGRLVVAVEGDSAFGFSAAECETICRYKLPVVVLVFNNGGIYGGDRREPALKSAAEQGAQAGGFGADPPPTGFVAGSKYEMLMQAFGGEGVRVGTAQELAVACQRLFAARRPALVNIEIDPAAGAESGNVHSFNAPKAKL